MKNHVRTITTTLIFVFIFVFSTLSSSAQYRKPAPPAHAPYDFSDKFYVNQGIEPAFIIARRNGRDGLSVVDKMFDASYTNVRVLVTVPAYNQSGDPMFWYPLGELQDNGFMDTKLGFETKQIASLHPIYVFPDPRVMSFNAFAGTRQAPIIDDSWRMFTGRELNPLGVREIKIVNYTDKAFSKEGFEMMAYFGKKNGYAVDDTPIIKTLIDIEELVSAEMVTVETMVYREGSAIKGKYTIAPLILDPTKGVIRPDAFLWMAMKDGTSLPAEAIFVDQFGCLQKTGEFCQ